MFLPSSVWMATHWLLGAGVKMHPATLLRPLRSSCGKLTWRGAAPRTTDAGTRRFGRRDADGDVSSITRPGRTQPPHCPNYKADVARRHHISLLETVV